MLPSFKNPCAGVDGSTTAQQLVLTPTAEAVFVGYRGELIDELCFKLDA